MFPYSRVYSHQSHRYYYYRARDATQKLPCCKVIVSFCKTFEEFTMPFYFVSWRNIYFRSWTTMHITDTEVEVSTLTPLVHAHADTVSVYVHIKVLLFRIY